MQYNPIRGLPEPQALTRNLIALCEHHGVPLGPDQAKLCIRHVQAMLQWNLRSNLTRITQADEILSKHLLDSLLPARWLPRQGLALDIGTGAGFPGIPLKILFPDLHMVLLEANHKKTSFLKILIPQLQLEGLSALQGRWETFATINDSLVRQPFELITMRALKILDKTFGLFAARILLPGGMFAHWSGPQSAVAEPVAAQKIMGEAFSFEGCHNYALPHDAGKRQLLIWKRKP
jgi:16S rRNA (guanine527-N7)-methyltransferase